MFEKNGGTTYPLTSQDGLTIRQISLISVGSQSQFFYDSQIAGYKYSAGSKITMEIISTFGLEIQCISFTGYTYSIQINYIPYPTQIHPQLPASSQFKVTQNNGNVMIDDMYINAGGGNSILYWLWYQPISQPDTFATISFGLATISIPN